jgi:TPR repeat protein
MSPRTVIFAGFLSLLVPWQPMGAEPLYGEKGGLDQAMKFGRLGRLGDALRALADLKSAQAKAMKAGLIGKDTVYLREHGVTDFDPALAQVLGKEAIPELLKQAKSDPLSARLLGALYFWGTGVTADTSAGARLWKSAAERGESGAMTLMALCCRDGLGVEQDKQAAAAWAKKASDAGNPGGMQLLGEFYYFGELVPKNPVLAMQLWEKAADLGHVDSMIRCADLSFERAMKALRATDPNGAKSYFKAFQDRLEKAAGGGDVRAMLRLGDLYRVGLWADAPMDLPASFRFYSQASKSGLTIPLASVAACYYTGVSVKVDRERADALLGEAVKAAARDAREDKVEIEAIASMPDLEARKAALLSFLRWDRVDTQ